jgi:hypothetical protein
VIWASFKLSSWIFLLLWVRRLIGCRSHWKAFKLGFSPEVCSGIGGLSKASSCDWAPTLCWRRLKEKVSISGVWWSSEHWDTCALVLYVSSIFICYLPLWQPSYLKFLYRHIGCSHSVHLGNLIYSQSLNLWWQDKYMSKPIHLTSRLWILVLQWCSRSLGCRTTITSICSSSNCISSIVVNSGVFHTNSAWWSTQPYAHWHTALPSRCWESDWTRRATT